MYIVENLEISYKHISLLLDGTLDSVPPLPATPVSQGRWLQFQFIMHLCKSVTFTFDIVYL